MKYENKSFSVGMPRVTQEQWDAIFAKKRQERRTKPTTDLGSEFIRSIHEVAGEPAAKQEEDQ